MKLQALVCSILILLPSICFGDIVTETISFDLNAVAGDNMDADGLFDFGNASASAMDSGPPIEDFQQASASVTIEADADPVAGDFQYELFWGVSAFSAGIGNADAFASGVLVFTLTDSYLATGLGIDFDDSTNDPYGNEVGVTLTNSRQETILLGSREQTLLVADTYTLAATDQVFAAGFFDDQYGGYVGESFFTDRSRRLNFFTIPEPSSTIFGCVTFAVLFGRRRNR